MYLDAIQRQFMSDWTLYQVEQTPLIYIALAYFDQILRSFGIIWQKNKTKPEQNIGDWSGAQIVMTHLLCGVNNRLLLPQFPPQAG